MKDVTVESYGPSALIIRFAHAVSRDSLARRRGILARLESLSLTGVTDIVPAYGEILLEFDFPIEKSHSATRRLLETAVAEAEPIPAAAARLHEIPVRYDGPDLADLAREKGLAIDEVVALHAGPVYDIYQIGFSPGFPYLGPLDSRLHAPRLANPRTSIAPGSVAIGGEHTGIYSVASPGGWRIIGHTEVPIFRPQHGRGGGSEEAFLLHPGDRVKFIPLQ